jgi:hypothetical protein
MLSIHAQSGTGAGTNAAGMLSGGLVSSSLVGAPRSHSGDKVVDLVFLELHNYRSHSGYQVSVHHHMVILGWGHQHSGSSGGEGSGEGFGPPSPHTQCSLFSISVYCL